MDIKLRVETFAVGPLDNNSYLIIEPSSLKALVVDPSMDSDDVAKRIVDLKLSLEGVVNTHGHFDHTFNNALFAERFSAPVLIHEADLPLLREMVQHAENFGFEAKASPEPASFLHDGVPIKVGERELAVLFTPGHSPGGVCLAADDFVISGDTLFAGSIGRTDLPGGDFNQLADSIRSRLYSLPNSTTVLPGHGPPTTIGAEKKDNPFVPGRVL